MAALEAKNKGNAAFSAGKYEEAIQHFTQAINLDPKNHVLYSNRSAAYASMSKFQEALGDAEKTIDLNPEWIKGYSRKAAALHGLKRYDDAEKAYKEGLKLEPNNEQLKSGLQELKRAKVDTEAMDMFGQLFQGDIWTKLKSNPQTEKFLNQPDFVKIMTELQKNPSLTSQYVRDPRVTSALGVLMGIPIHTQRPDEPINPDVFREQPQDQPTPRKEKKEEPKPEPMDVETKNLSSEEKEALDEKNKGNEAYKKKDFENAIKHYTRAMELDPHNAVYYTNRAAVYTEMGKYTEAVQDCEKAIEESRAKFDGMNVAKAYQRMGNVYMKAKDYEKAVNAYNKSLTEDRNKTTLDLLKKAEKLYEEKKKQDYLDPVKAAEAKERGNQLFTEGKYPAAVKEYTEAINRDPSNPVYYSNRAACYTKLAEYRLGLKDCDEAIRLKPDFVKAYTRKGHCHFFLKEYDKALEAYDKGLQLEPNNQELTEGAQRTVSAMNQTQNANQPNEAAMRDPEVQEILSDPVMRQILHDMQSNPAAAADHLKSPLIQAKIQKLINAGILRVA